MTAEARCVWLHATTAAAACKTSQLLMLPLESKNTVSDSARGAVEAVYHARRATACD